MFLFDSESGMNCTILDGRADIQVVHSFKGISHTGQDLEPDRVCESIATRFEHHVGRPVCQLCLGTACVPLPYPRQLYSPLVSVASAGEMSRDHKPCRERYGTDHSREMQGSSGTPPVLTLIRAICPCESAILAEISLACGRRSVGLSASSSPSPVPGQPFHVSVVRNTPTEFCFFHTRIADGQCLY